jgi:hypothetical protein
MPVLCDKCGKQATLENKPQNIHWMDWLSDEKRGHDAFAIIPCEADIIGVICGGCVETVVAEWRQSRNTGIET